VPRKPREEVEGGVFHVFARGNNKQVIYRDEIDRNTYLRLLRRTVERCHWRLMAYCLMENHVHLLLSTPQPTLGRGMREMHGMYAQVFNARHDRVGHLFQGRYKCVRIKTDEQLWTVAVYIARNPVEAGLCGAPEDWRWSSHAMVASAAAPEWVDAAQLLGYFAAAGGDGRRRYVAMTGRGSDPLSVDDSRGLTPSS
jgi:REP-associated tyrosine transposase